MVIEKFNQQKYIAKYNKENYKRYVVYVKKSKATEFDGKCATLKIKSSKVFAEAIEKICNEKVE